MDKKELRELVLKKRSELNKEIKEKLDDSIYQQVIKIIGNYKSIGIFINFNDEINTKNIIQYCFDHKIKVSVPKITGKEMIFVEINSWNNLKKGVWGILEPISDIETKDLDLCITALLAYNSKLNRLGYGGGYYDKYFQKNKVYKIGLAYQFQYQDYDIYNNLDVKMDVIIKAC
jgi:5-formyltetrahydrofolate cyclo-ligase